MLLLVAAVLIGALLASAAVGVATSRWVIARTKNPDTQGAGLLLGAATGLLGLLIGFTFAMSSERFETRRELVVAEANALSTTYLRDSMLPAPYSARLDALVTRYGKARLAFFDAGRDPARLAKVAQETGALQDQIWWETAAALRLPQSATLTVAVLATTNEMFDLAASRFAARQAPVPREILWLLAFAGIVTSALCGYNLALGGALHRVALSALLAVIGSSMALIVDLDWPTRGLIVVPQQPMISEVADLEAHEARRSAFVLPDPPPPVIAPRAP